MVSFNDLCDNCKHQSCCTNSAVPLVFSEDYNNLKQIDKASKKFLKQITINGKKVKAIKKKRNSSICVFWDEEQKRCSIYKNRPFDCRAYPFDISNIDGRYYWIVYSCNPESNWEWSEDFLQMLENDKGFFKSLQNIKNFARHTEMVLPSELKKTPFTVLREVRIKPK